MKVSILTLLPGVCLVALALRPDGEAANPFLPTNDEPQAATFAGTEWNDEFTNDFSLTVHERKRVT